MSLKYEPSLEPPIILSFVPCSSGGGGGGSIFKRFLSLSHTHTHFPSLSLSLTHTHDPSLCSSGGGGGGNSFKRSLRSISKGEEVHLPTQRSRAVSCFTKGLWLLDKTVALQTAFGCFTKPGLLYSLSRPLAAQPHGGARGFRSPWILGCYVTKFAPHKALKLIA